MYYPYSPNHFTQPPTKKNKSNIYTCKCEVESIPFEQNSLVMTADRKLKMIVVYAYTAYSIY